MLQHAGFLDFQQLGPTDWLRVEDDAPIGRGLRIVRSADMKAHPLEWRIAPAQHPGAVTPQLLYRSPEPRLINSFLSVLSEVAAGRRSDIDLVARMFTPHACHPKLRYVYQGWVIARAEIETRRCYMAAIYCNRENDADVASIWRVERTSRTNVVAGPLDRRIDWAKPWNCRFNLAGGALKGKWWNSDVIEPQTWDLAGADEGLSGPGLIGFASTVHGAIADNVWGMDWYAWSSDPTIAAPLYPIEVEG